MPLSFQSPSSQSANSTSTRRPFALIFSLLNNRGGDLFNYFQLYDTLNESETKFMAVCIILGLEYFHKKSIPYIDIRPENIVLKENGYPLLEDLGPGMIKQDQIYAAPEISAPELHKGKKTIAADLWALGCCLYLLHLQIPFIPSRYELLYGILPFYHENPEVLRSLKETQLPWFSVENKEASPEMVSFIEQLLQVDPRKREFCLNDNCKGCFKGVKDHIWLQDVNWAEYLSQTKKSPLKLGDRFDERCNLEKDFIWENV